MRAREFISEAMTKPTPMEVPEPQAADPKTVTDPKAPGDLLAQMQDIADKPVPAVKENTKNKRKKK